MRISFAPVVGIRESDQSKTVRSTGVAGSASWNPRSFPVMPHVRSYSPKRNFVRSARLSHSKVAMLPTH